MNEVLPKLHVPLARPLVQLPQAKFDPDKRTVNKLIFNEHKFSLYYDTNIKHKKNKKILKKD